MIRVHDYVQCSRQYGHEISSVEMGRVDPFDPTEPAVEADPLDAKDIRYR